MSKDIGSQKIQYDNMIQRLALAVGIDFLSSATRTELLEIRDCDGEISEMGELSAQFFDLAKNATLDEEIPGDDLLNALSHGEHTDFWENSVERVDDATDEDKALWTVIGDVYFGAIQTVFDSINDEDNLAVMGFDEERVELILNP